jgi:hypothetical protein
MALKWYPHGRNQAKVSPNEMAKLLILDNMLKLGYIEEEGMLDEATQREKEEVDMALNRQGRRVRDFLGADKLRRKLAERRKRGR